ncbi:MAG: cyclic nucleotide-binding domain-containing protein [Myxococcota bacterium]|nr:cyclic nucleotide-binding domain-containing protein [Myxococcota bacterium]
MVKASPNTPKWRRLLWPLIVLAVFLTPTLYWDSILTEVGTEVITQTIQIIRYSFATLAWLSIAWLVIRLLDVFFWEMLVAPSLGGKVPRLLKDVLAAIVFLLAITGIVGGVFELPVTGLWATSGVVGLVVGLALQSMISDVFSGIAINIDRPYIIGDWIQVHVRGIDLMIGCVEEVNWRSTKILTKDNVMHMVPNHLINQIVVTNLSRPQLNSRFELLFCIDFSVSSERALRILNAGVLACDGILKEPAPKARVNQITSRGVEYYVRYWLNPKQFSPSKGRHAVCSSILNHLHQAGVTLAYHKQDVFIANMPNRQLDIEIDRIQLLRRVDLAKHLTEDELATLSQNMKRHDLDKGSVIVNEGEQGDSMYLLVEGLLSVYRAVGEGDGYHTTRVGKLGPGQYFGEMSLLTGEPRSATVQCITSSVVYEISHGGLKKILGSRPELAEAIALTVAKRRVDLAQAEKNANHQNVDGHSDSSVTNDLLNRIRSFFFG